MRLLSLSLLVLLGVLFVVKWQNASPRRAAMTLEEKIDARIADEEEGNRNNIAVESRGPAVVEQQQHHLEQHVPGDIDDDGVAETHREEEDAVAASRQQQQQPNSITPKRSFYDVITTDPLFSGTKISNYAAKRGTAGLPILVLCYNRAEQLGETLDVLLTKVRHVTKDSILVAQDDAQEETANEARRRSLMLVQNMHNSVPGGFSCRLVYIV